MPKKKMPKWRIECGNIAGTVSARTIGAAWRKLTRAKLTGFAPLARFYQCYKNQPWQYMTPAALDKSE